MGLCQLFNNAIDKYPYLLIYLLTYLIKCTTTYQKRQISLDLSKVCDEYYQHYLTFTFPNEWTYCKVRAMKMPDKGKVCWEEKTHMVTGQYCWSLHPGSTLLLRLSTPSGQWILFWRQTLPRAQRKPVMLAHSFRQSWHKHSISSANDMTQLGSASQQTAFKSSQVKSLFKSRFECKTIHK